MDVINIRLFNQCYKKMNRMEVSGGVGAVVGAIKIAFVGYTSYGWIGLILGIPIGLFIGILLGTLFIFLLFFMGVAKEKYQKRTKNRYAKKITLPKM